MKKYFFLLLFIGVVLLFFFFFVGRSGAMSSFAMSSFSFDHNGAIPTKYTCEGDDISPEIFWSNSPKGTKSFALIMDDPDAPTAQPWVHWVVFNIPANVTGLSENSLSADLAKRGAIQGITNSEKAAYHGPCPPKGHGTHHYHFKLYALDTLLNLSEGATKDVLLDAMKGHILAQGELVGTYERM